MIPPVMDSFRVSQRIMYCLYVNLGPRVDHSVPGLDHRLLLRGSHLRGDELLLLLHDQWRHPALELPCESNRADQSGINLSFTGAGAGAGGVGP